MRPPSRILSLFVLTLAGACAGQKPKGESAPTPTTQAQEAGIDVQALLAKELEPQATHAVAAADGSFKGSIEASAPPKLEAGEGYVQITAPLGEGELMCFVYPTAKDLGGMLRIMADSTLKEMPEHQWVDVRADQVNGWGYLEARANYLFDSPQGKLLGDFKLAASVRDETTVMCLLDVPGLYGTFERSVRTLLGSLKLKGKKPSGPKPVSASIVRGQVPGRMVALERTYHLKQGKNKVSISYNSTLAIGPNGTLVTSDGASAETYAKGSLESGQYASASDGRTLYNLALKRENQTYKVQGVVQDQPVAAEFAVVPGFLDSDRSREEICKVQRGKEAQLTLVDYSPDFDPLHASSMLVEKNATPEGDVRFTRQGNAAAQTFVKLDKKCDLEGGTVKTGQLSVQLERLWQDKPQG